MYAELYLIKQHQSERLRRAEELQVSQRVVQLRKLRKRQVRAERELLHAWQRVEELESTMSAG